VRRSKGSALINLNVNAIARDQSIGGAAPPYHGVGATTPAGARENHLAHLALSRALHRRKKGRKEHLSAAIISIGAAHQQRFVA